MRISTNEWTKALVAARPEFPDQRQIDHRSQPGFQPQGLKLCVALHGQHHADEQTGDGYHRQRHDADLIEARQEHIPPLPPGEDPAERLQREDRHITDTGDLVEHEFTHIGDQPGQPIGQIRAGTAGGRGGCCSGGWWGGFHAGSGAMTRLIPLASAVRVGQLEPVMPAGDSRGGVGGVGRLAPIPPPL